MVDTQAAAVYWDSFREWRDEQPERIRWWESETIWRSINQRVCGKALPGADTGLVDLMCNSMKVPVDRAVSVGSGPGFHEASFLQAGIAESFDLYDISKDLLDTGRKHADQLGLADRCRFHHADAFAEPAKPIYDLAFWGSSLHHMPSAEAAVKWSFDSLKPGGWFVMNEYVGANRFQWPLTAMLVVNLLRAVLPAYVFRNKSNPAKPLPRFLRAPTLAAMEYDPSEAIDAEAIIPAVLKYFPDATIKHIGGTILHIGLSDILTNIPEESALLRNCILLDRLTSFIPHLAVAIAQKA